MNKTTLATLLTFTLILLLSASSCIKENYSMCPDYGKYRITFYERSGIEHNAAMNAIVIFNPIDRDNSLSGICRFTRAPGDSLLKQESPLRLYPGDYNFKAFLTKGSIQYNNKMVKIKNQELHVMADTIERVSKLGENRVLLTFVLSNSQIEVQCNLDPRYRDLYRVYEVEMSAPDDRDIFLDTESGSCNYSQTITEYYDYFLYSEISNIFEYYCVPFLGGCYLNFRFKLYPANEDEDSENGKTIMLQTRIFLNMDINQGKAYRFTFNVTPYEVNYLSTSVRDWFDNDCIDEIPLI
ncbi:MAG: hypothetical protein Q8S04_02045 [Bacteroidales bacterium]|nr:hypothetical protein [Bacteroidales bacterium]